MLKRSKTGHVYFQLKETFLGEGGVILHTYIYFHRDLGQMGHANGSSYVLGGGAVILHTHIYTFMEIWVKGAMQKDHLKRTI